jgi:putative protease
MVTFQKPGYEKKNDALQEEIVNKYAGGAPKIKADGRLVLRLGAPAVYEVSAENVRFCASGIEVMAAEKKPLQKDEVCRRMEKTGDTPFCMEHLSIEMDEPVFLPNGALNQLRRDALEGLKTAMLSPYFRENKDCQPKIKSGLQTDEAAQNAPGFAALTENRAHLSAILANSHITTVYLDYAAYDLPDGLDELAEDVEFCRAAGKRVCFALPRIFREDTAAEFNRLAGALRRLPLDGFLVRNYEEIGYIRDHFMDGGATAYALVADHNLYAWNDLAGEVLAELGFSKTTVPPELNRGEIRHRDNRQSEMVVYGRCPLMTSAQCVHANTSRCDKTPTVTYLGDRYRRGFPVRNVCGACYNVVYNSLPVLLFAQLEELARAGLCRFRLDFTVEEPAEVEEVLSLMDAFADGKMQRYPGKWQDRYTNGHYKRGVE